MNDKAQLLFDWRQQRLALEQNYNKEGLQELTDWFNSLKPSMHGLNYDDIDTWPTMWEYLADGYYSISGNGLGFFYTIVHTFPEKEPELWLIHDLYYSHMYLITVVDGYVLNRMSNEVELFDDVKHDLNTLEKHTKQSVLDATKWNNK